MGNADLPRDRLVAELVELRRRNAELELALQELRAAEQGLQRGVEERTAELTSARRMLRAEIASREELERAVAESQKMESIGRLAGGLAHDFNNVLTLILGFGQAVQSALPSGQGLESTLLGIRRAAESTARLTHQLLAYSSTLETEVAPISLNDVILSMDGLLRPLIGEDIELVALPDPDLGAAMADPAQVEQVLMNLAANAREAMPGGGKLIIETANYALDVDAAERRGDDVPAGRYVVLSMTDTGPGISESVRSRVFEPFFTTKRSGRGSGLGLATCYGIVKEWGGHIEVEGGAGRGTTFRILLPRVETPAVAASPPEEQPRLPGGDGTVLLVEDEPLVRQYAAAALRGQGYTVWEAANGHEALSLAGERRDRRIDLLLTDLVMPLMSGRELASLLRESRPGARVLYTSGYVDDQTVTQEALGDAGFMQKPFTPSTLAAKVREVLAR